MSTAPIARVDIQLIPFTIASMNENKRRETTNWKIGRTGKEPQIVKRCCQLIKRQCASCDTRITASGTWGILLFKSVVVNIGYFTCSPSLLKENLIFQFCYKMLK